MGRGDGLRVSLRLSKAKGRRGSMVAMGRMSVARSLAHVLVDIQASCPVLS